MKRLLVFLFLATCSFAQTSPVDSLIAAERAFAKKSHDTSAREAFLAFVTDQAVIFNPGPMNAKQVYTKAPSLNPPPTILDWAPAYAEVSQSGNMGFTTGPYTVTDNKTKSVTGHGTFFSVWEKQVSGEWKVALDFGIPTAEARDLRDVKVKKGAPSTFHEKTPLAIPAEMAELTRAESLLSAGTPEARATAYADALSSEAFVVQDGLQPITSITARNKHLAAVKKITRWALSGGSLSSSHDLAYIFGSYEVHVSADPKSAPKMGYYARVWKRDAQGKWKIVLDNTRAPQD